MVDDVLGRLWPQSFVQGDRVERLRNKGEVCIGLLVFFATLRAGLLED